MPNEKTERRFASQGMLRATVTRLSLFLQFEQKILAIIVAYALAIGVFALIVPLTVQEGNTPPSRADVLTTVHEPRHYPETALALCGAR